MPGRDLGSFHIREKFWSKGGAGDEGAVFLYLCFARKKSPLMKIISLLRLQNDVI